MKCSRLICILLSIFVIVSCGSTRSKNNSKVSLDTSSYIQELEDYRAQKKLEYEADSHYPLKGKELEYLRYFPANSAFKVDATITVLDKQESVTVKTSAGEERQYIPYATLQFEIAGKPFSLQVHTSPSFNSIPAYKDLMFLMFYDLTNGEETYGGGRYIDLYKTDIKNGKITLDFNKAYHPYCHYSSGYSCAIPPAENHVNIKILAGEKNYAGTYKGGH